MSTEATARAPLTSSGVAARKPGAAVLALPSAYEVETVSDTAALHALAPAWTRLLEAAGVDHPFLAHEWIVTWWECFGLGHLLHVLVVKAAGQVVAIAPLMVLRQRLYGLRVRQLQLIANVHAQRADFIVARGAEGAYRAIWERLRTQQALWDLMVLPQLPEGSPTLDRVPRLAERDGLPWGAWRSADSPWIRVEGTWEDYERGLARKHRSNLRNRMKRLRELGAVEMEVVTGGARLDQDLDEGLALEAAAWKGDAGTAIRCHPDLVRFYGRLAERTAEQGWLRLQFLTVGGRRIAFAYALCFKDALFLLKPGYDPAYAAYSPSNLLCMLVLREAFASSVRAYDLLGANDTWKRDWTDEARAHSWLFVFGRGARARLLYLAKFRLLPWLKRVHKSLS
jgi:CelD/BcsL family acetyltransferase involved in cellulose biosynthesis